MNETLLNKSQWELAYQYAQLAELRSTTDMAKNWVFYLTAEAILQNYDQDDKIVIFEEQEPEFGSWLDKLGYHNIIVAHPSFTEDRKLVPDTGITLLRQGPAKTTLGTHSVDAVVELFGTSKGLAVEDFMPETRRILKPGGRLYQALDYWPEPLDVSNAWLDEAKTLHPRILNRQAALAHMQIAKKNRLRPSSIPRLQANEKPVTWERMGLSYTILLLSFIRDNINEARRIETSETKTQQEDKPIDSNLHQGGELGGDSAVVRDGGVSPQRNEGRPDLGPQRSITQKSVS